MHTHYFGGLVQGAGPPAGQVASGDLGGCAAGSGYAGTPCGRGFAPCTDPRVGAACPLIRAQPAPAEPGLPQAKPAAGRRRRPGLRP